MSLDQVVGQALPVTILKRALQTGRIAHSYLFHGDDGVGKKTTATVFAQHLLCEEGSACGCCSSCQRFLGGQHSGFVLLETESSIKIDDIRRVQSQCALRRQHYMIWLVDRAEKMTIQAANCFLKTLEEPAAQIVFILLTTNPGQLLPTVISRCQLVPFRSISEDDLVALLQAKTGSDDRTRTRLVARLARGSVGRALNLWDGPFLERRRLIFSHLAQLPSMSIPQTLGLGLTWDENRDTVIADLELMLQWYRDLAVTKIGVAELIYNQDFQNELQAVSKKYSLESLQRITKTIGQLIPGVRRNMRPRYILGYLLLQMKKGALA